MTLYVIFPIHLNFQIRSRCVSKAIIHRKTQCRAYARLLLHAVPTYNALFEFFWRFSHSKKLKFGSCLGGFHVWIALNLLKTTLFSSIPHACPAFLQYALQWIVLQLLEKVFSFSKKRFLWYYTCMWYLINFSILSRSLPIFHVSLSIIYLLFLPYHVLYTWFFLNICRGFSLWQFSFNILIIWKDLLLFFNLTNSLLIKKGLIVEKSLGLIYILPY